MFQEKKKPASESRQETVLKQEWQAQAFQDRSRISQTLSSFLRRVLFEEYKNKNSKVGVLFDLGTLRISSENISSTLLAAVW
jgi:hypothetical protein